jgi:ElaB/YqjD/DUF883 family membrane-anchored ribosome-binding protein
MAMVQRKAAQRKNGASKSRSRRKAHARRTRANSTLARARAAMSKAVTPDLADMRAEMQQLMSDLEDRIDRFNALTKRGAGHAVDGVNDLVYGAFNSVTDRVRENTRAVSEDAAKLGNQALREVGAQIDKRPLLTLAIAAGIGFIAGLARRPD